MKRLIPLALFLSSCAANTNPEGDDVAESNEGLVTPGLLDFDTKVLHNFAGETRYVRNNADGVKLYMSDKALETDNPIEGFADQNHFENSCAPTAALNVFTWYGITKLVDVCYLVPASKSLSPTLEEKCDPLTPTGLGNEMDTNDWGVPIWEEGTTSPNFWRVFKKYLGPFIKAPDELEYNYDHQDSPLWRYEMLKATLAQGHPVVVVFSTGAIKGHFATIVGIEKGIGGSFLDNRIIMANGREEDLTYWKSGESKPRHAISYEKFNDLWERNLVSNLDWMVGTTEHAYARFHVWDTSQPLPPEPTGPASNGGGFPPKKLN